MQFASSTISYAYTGTNYTNPHAPTSVGSNTLSYDNSGNLQSDGVATYAYNYRDRLTTISPNSSTTITYLYDHNNQRITQQSGNTLTYTPNRYHTSVGTTTTKNIFLNDILIGLIEGTITKNVLADHLGSTDKIVNTSGNIISSTNYLPYGTERLQTGTQSLRKYIGEQLDSTGLNYLNARYYSSTQGQFISQDPVYWELGSTENGKKALLNPQSQNSYAYSLNNPMTYKDPDGEFAQLAAPAIIIAQQAVKGAVIGAVTNIAIQGAYDAYNGQLSSGNTYLQTGIEGAAVGAATLGASSFIGVGKAVVPTASEKVIEVGSKKVTDIVKGFTSHGVDQAITRNFKTKDIIEIVRKADPVDQIGKYGQVQTKYNFNSNSVVVDSISKKVITVFSDVVGTLKGLGKGNFKP